MAGLGHGGRPNGNAHSRRSGFGTGQSARCANPFIYPAAQHASGRGASATSQRGISATSQCGGSAAASGVGRVAAIAIACACADKVGHGAAGAASTDPVACAVAIGTGVLGASDSFGSAGRRLGCRAAVRGTRFQSNTGREGQPAGGF